MYYLIYIPLYLLSLLPMRALYFLADAVYGLLYYIIGYRRKVVMTNLGIAFPQKTAAERTRIAKDFYHNFIDTFVEVIKMISASDSFFEKRVAGNWEVINNLYDEGRAIQIHLGHTFNWEWGNLEGGKKMKHTFLGVYMPLTNKLMNRLFMNIRSRTGTVLLPATDMKRAILPYRNTCYALGLVADQAPSNPERAFWLNFFNRPTPFITGPEKGAHAGGLPVVFANIEKPKRGYYKIVFTLATENAGKMPVGALTLQYVRYLENVIHQQPAMWLWSHRRWKHSWKPGYTSLWIDDQPLQTRAAN